VVSCAEGCIRYKAVARIDFAVVRSLFETIAANNAAMC
jgi:hypothetical protein